MSTQLIALPAPNRGFNNEEFVQRTTRAQAAMRRQSIDLLLLMTEPEVRYFSGFLTQFWQSPTRPWFLVVPQTGDPIAVIPAIGLECMNRTWIEDIRTWSSPHPVDDGIGLLQSTIIEVAGHAPVIGLPMGTESSLRMPLTNFQHLQTSIPNAKWQDGTSIIQSLRQIKSSAEIEKIRYSAQVASTAFAALPNLISSGVEEHNVFRIFKQSCLQLGVDDTAYVVGGSGSGGYGDIISPPSNRVLESGDILILDTGCVWDGYFCDFDRNFAIGQADEQSELAYRIAWDATEAGLAAIQVGATCSDLFKAMHNVMAPHAIDTQGDVGRLGHGLGMQLTETPSLTEFDQTILEPGMVLTLEPGYNYAPGKMMVHEENIVVRENGVELLTERAAPALPVIA